MPALAIATPILRATRRAPWRTLLFVTASAVALSASPRASAQDCGPVVDGAVTCAVDDVGPDYPIGITYNEPAALTLHIDDGVAVTPTDNGPGVTATSAAGPMIVNAPNVAITTVGPGAHGMIVDSGAGGSTIDLGGTIDAPGATAAGLIVDSTGGSVSVTTAADIFGGGLGGTGGGIVIGGDNTFALLANSGIIGATSDRAVSSTSPDLAIENSGTITGYVTLNSAAVNFFNSGTLELRNFIDTNADGTRDTEAVAVADFGGAGVFDNAQGGTVTLGDVVGATAWTPLPVGSVLPEIGDPAGFDITVEGVERAELTGLTSFNNAGAIDMQDGVAGDVLAITSGGESPTTYFSEGGTLLLDTVLNEGGALASLSDVLLLDAAELGAGGPTLVSIQNVGGAGAQTIEDGILVVDLLNPELSASGVFELDGFVIAGPWQYGLFQGGDAATGGDPLDGNWYLRTDGFAPTTDAYRALPGSLKRSARLAIGTLQQRVGNRWWHVPEQRTQRTVTDPAPPPQPQTREFVVFFDWDKYDIRPDAAAVIQEAAEYARSGNAARIVVLAHTDTSGSAEYNMGLSERRAGAVSQALQTHGVAAQVIGMEWFGETQPAVDTGDGVREERNRRAYVQVSVPGTPDPNAAGRTRVVEDVVPASTQIQGAGVWGRIVGVDSEFQRDDDLAEADETAFMVQGGVDFVVSQSDTSTFIGSVSAHYVDSETDVATVDFGDVATIDSEGWGVSGGVTWYNENGAYVDGILSATWFESDIGSDVLGELASGNEGFAWAASVEGGMRYEASPNYYWVPQGQLIYSHVDIDEFTDPFGASVEEADADSLLGRLGVAFEYLKTAPNDAGTMTRTQAYGIVNLLYEFLDAGGAEISGIELDEDGEDLWGELGAGFSYGFDPQWSIYGEASYRTALEDFGDSQAIQGSLGLRYNW